MKFSSDDFIEEFDKGSPKYKNMVFHKCRLDIRSNKQQREKLLSRLQMCTQCSEYISKSGEVIFNKNKPDVEDVCSQCGLGLYHIWKHVHFNSPKCKAFEAVLEHAKKIGFIPH
jgi:diphthamide synthase (EF-2-diphthine--ammonia ligase)